MTFTAVVVNMFLYKRKYPFCDPLPNSSLWYGMAGRAERVENTKPKQGV